ncbi:MAG: ELM1/GtrOC1 family putative glycosyltransferase [Candidatus Binatia bacterium]
MPFLTTRRLKDRIFPSPDRLPTAGVRDLPQKIVLPARSGVTPSPKAPVRIYVGTEAGQYRAERVFIFSVDKYRDPSRVYEIHLMKDVRGYDRRWWLTGFTNYRFAVAEWAGSAGRAIYNDVDQIYLADPAELFDTDMGGKGFLAISGDDTAVMLIDCERMAKVWTHEVVGGTPRKRIEKMSHHEWGQLEACWHARDFDYVPDYSKCLHYTTIHEQPWHPFPDVFVYMPGPVSGIWHDMEREADQQEYCSFDFTTEDTLYTDFIARMRRARSEGRSSALVTLPPPPPMAGLGEMLAQAGARSILEFKVADARNEALESRVGKYPGATLTTYDPTATEAAGVDVPLGPFDAVICTMGLDLLSNEDIPWILDQLMYRARRAAFVTVDDVPRSIEVADGTRIVIKPRGFAWWRKQMEAASRNQPEIRWRLGVRRRTLLGAEVVEWREGGKRLEDTPPRVWILADPKPGHTTQSIGLADTLGWPYEIKDGGFPSWSKVTDRLLGPLTVDLSGQRGQVFRAPWPDLVISTGWSTGPIARWIAKQGEGRTSVIAMGRKGGDVATNFDLVATCSYVRYPPHERRIALSAPLCQVTPARLQEAAAKFPDLFAGKSSPRIVVLAGGDCVQYEFDDATARRLGEDVAALARKHDASVIVVTSRRTPPSAVSLIESSLRSGDKPVGEVHRWSASRAENPYLGYLAGAEVLLVTGESESMLAEACATGKPVYIYPLRKKAPGLAQRLIDTVTTTAFMRPRKSKGTFRPQQGREYFCSRLIERGVVHPTRDLEEFHRGLVAAGYAKMFDGSLDLATHPALNEADVVAARVRALLGVHDDRRAPEEPLRASIV